MKILKCTLDDLDLIAEFAYTKNKIETERCRPFLANDSIEKIKVAYTRDIIEKERDILLMYDKDKLIGFTSFFWIPEDKYLQLIRGIYALNNYDLVASNFLNYFKENFRDYKMYTNNAKEHLNYNNFFLSRDFEQLEDAQLYKLEDYSNGFFSSKIDYLNQTNEDAIYLYMNKFIDEDTYWTTERLKNNLDKFIILGYFDKTIKGYIEAQIYKDNSIEICGLEAESKKIKSELMSALSKISDEKGFSSIFLYSERKDEIDIAKELNYKYYDSNICFMKQL